jgi:predicted Rossmann fold nucleotide-binding protein DprA/Smf involved in DNA uptake
MTREEALLKLLAVEPATRAELLLVTGWPIEETTATLQQLQDQGKVTYRNGCGHQWFQPAAARTNRATAMKGRA